MSVIDFTNFLNKPAQSLSKYYNDSLDECFLNERLTKPLEFSAEIKQNKLSNWYYYFGDPFSFRVYFLDEKNVPNKVQRFFLKKVFGIGVDKDV